MKRLFLWFKNQKRLTKLFLLMLVLGLTAVGYRRWHSSAVTVEVAQVSKGELVEEVVASGEVSASRLASLAFGVSGKLAYLGVADGSEVRRGAVLASLDKIPLDAAYQQALNLSRRYSATVDNIHDQLKGKDTTETYAERDTRTTAEATNDYYYNALRTAEYNLQNASLYAPFNGVVSNLLSGLAVGANVTLGVTVMRVVDPQSVYFDAEVSEAEVNLIDPEMVANISLDAYPSEVFEGSVEVVSFGNYTSGTGGNVYKVRISLPANDKLQFRLGMKGSAQIIVRKYADKIQVVSEAVIENETRYVWKVVAGRLVKQEVTTGVSSASATEIASGLNPGETVVLNPSAKLKAGLRVKQ